MKIIEAQKIYLANRSALVEQKKTLTSQRDKAKKMTELTGDSAYSDEAASLELTLKETEDKFLKNQDILDNLAEQHCNVANAEVNRQISDPETGLAAFWILRMVSVSCSKRRAFQTVTLLTLKEIGRAHV